MLIDQTVVVGQNVRAFLNKSARGKVIGVNGNQLTVEWSDGTMVTSSRYNFIVMKPGF